MKPSNVTLNYHGGGWQHSPTNDLLPVSNPATGEELGQTRISTPEEVEAAVRCAAVAWRDWRKTPATERVQPLFRLRQLLEDHPEDRARTITTQCGKTLAESRGELRRANDNVEVATMQSGF